MALTNDRVRLTGTATGVFERPSYRMRVTLQQAALALSEDADTTAIQLLVTNQGARIDKPVLDIAPGITRTTHGMLPEDGRPALVEIDVRKETSSLALRASGTRNAALLDLHVYDCTTGRCFSYEFTVPPRHEQSLLIRKPAPGRWLVRGAFGS
jgi:hypothetical protein